MTKTIEIVVSPSGLTRLETKGFAGAECREASQRIEAALGAKTGDRPTAEHFAHAELQEQQRISG